MKVLHTFLILVLLMGVSTRNVQSRDHDLTSEEIEIIKLLDVLENMEMFEEDLEIIEKIEGVEDE